MKPVKGKIGHRVYVEWIDSAADYGWQKEYGHCPNPIVSIGILVYADNSHITLTTSVTLTGSVNSPVSIPWCCITQFKQFEEIVIPTLED